MPARHVLTVMLAALSYAALASNAAHAQRAATAAADAGPPRLVHMEPFLQARFLGSKQNATATDAMGEGLDFLLGVYAHFKEHLRNAHELNDKAVIDLVRAAGVLGGTPHPTASGLGKAISELNNKLQRLGPGSCYPVLRRVLMAAVVKQRLQSTGFSWAESQELQRALAQLAWQLYVLHRQGAAHKPALEFMHVSKSGGTSMCSLSVLNGCRSRDTRCVFGVASVVVWPGQHMTHQCMLPRTCSVHG